MNIRPKTKRRLIILAIGLLVVVGAGVAVYGRYVQQRNTRIAGQRAAAMKAYAAGDYSTALKHFSKYLDETRASEWKPGTGDPEALFAYGKSRASVELVGARHLLEARNIFEHYLRLRPADEQAERMLLDIYPRLDQNNEAIVLADDVLSRRPGDLYALKAKIKALIQHGYRKDAKAFDEAIAVGEQLSAAAPDDLEGHLLTQLAAASAKHPPEDVIAKARRQVDAHPDDPRFELVLASAYVYADRLPEAQEWLRKAAARKAPDAKFVDELVIRLDALGMFRAVLPVLERAAADLGAADPSLTRKLVQRQWQAGQYAAVARRLEGLDPASERSDPALLGLRALALYALERGPDAAAVVDALDRRGKGDSIAFAWSTALKARFGAASLSPKEQLEKYKAALDRDPANAVLYYLRGEAYSKLGESALALDNWNDCARRAPSWAAPRTRRAAALLAEGRFADAVRAAEDAYKRATDDLGIVVIWAQAAYGLLEQSPGEKELEKLARTVEEIQRAVPGEPNTLPIHAAVLARNGKSEAAAQVVRAALSTEPPPSPALLARLAAVSRDTGLGLEDEIAGRLEQAVARAGDADAGPGPAIAAALDRLDAGDPAGGLKLLAAARAKAGAAGDTLPWRIAVAQYLDAIGDASAARTWVELAEQHPRDLAVQSAALRTRARFQDREFWKRTIGRVKDLTVENSQLWRLEEMRWLLTEPKLSDTDNARVLATLTELANTAQHSPEPRQLLAIHHERAANAPGASAQAQQAGLNNAVKAMEEACDRRPADVGMVAELARLMRAAGRGDEAIKYFDRCAARPRLQPAARLRLAELYADHGQPRRAIELARGLGDDVAPRLAKWHRALGENDAAAALYRRILDVPPVDGPAAAGAGAAPRSLDAQTVLDAATFFAARGEVAQAQKFLARLDDLRLQPGGRELVRAKYAERHAPADAPGWYAAATEVPNATAGAWRELAGYHLRNRRFGDAAARADAGLKKYPNDADLLAMKERARELEPLAQDPSAQPLLTYLSFDPRNAPAGEMLAVVRFARGGEPLGATVAKLRAAADRHPRFMPLQVASARGHLRMGEPDKAEQVARRAAAAFPGDVDAARLLCSVYAASAKWPELSEAAMTWRRLSPGDTLEPDVLLARVQLQAGDAAAAADRLRPHAVAEAARAAAGTAGVRAEAVELYARALIAQNNAADAAAMIEPLARSAETGEAWRRLWLDLAGAFRTRDLEAAAKWVTRVEPLVPADAPRERVALASAWYVIGREFGDREAIQNARRLAEPLTSDTAAAAEAWTLLAACDEGLGNLGAAEREYRKARELRPDNSDVMNNLAYVLLGKGDSKSLGEARELAEKAINAAPSVASYHDTLARIEAESGNFDAAVTRFKRALALDGNSLEAMIGLADVLSRTGRREDARQQLAQVNLSLRNAPRLSQPLAKQLDAVRAAVQNPVESGRAD